MNRRARRAWRTVLTLFAAVVGAGLGPGVAQAAPLEGAAVETPTAGRRGPGRTGPTRIRRP
jgi:hypothetical protein